MLKFERNRAKPTLIRFIFWQLAHGLMAACVAKGSDSRPWQPKNMKQRFGKKNT